MRFKTAACDRTGNKILLSDGYFVANRSTGEWAFLCVDAPEHPDDYSIPVDSFIESPEELVDWMAHLNEKTWFDAKKFADFFTRFRKQNNLQGSGALTGKNA